MEGGGMAASVLQMDEPRKAKEKIRQYQLFPALLRLVIKFIFKLLWSFLKKNLSGSSPWFHFG
jgi:hypothetical protein